MIDIDTGKIEKIIRHVAETEVMPLFKNLQKADIREKGPGDLVTVADEASERQFTKLLAEALPGSLVVGEEAVSKDKSVVKRMKEGEPVWVIDPVDGTYNFAHGNPKFGLLIALVQNGVTLYGWAFDAPGNRMAIAQKGQGTFLNGKRIKINCKATKLEELSGRSSHPYNVPLPFKELISQRCALHDYMDFITGAADFVVHKPKVTPWDHAANNLIAAEAGAHVAMDAVDTPYDPTLYGPAFLLATPDRDWWQKLFPLLHLKAARRA